MIPSIPSACVSIDFVYGMLVNRIQPNSVAMDAIMKDGINGPQVFWQFVKSAPNSIKGVASCKLNVCNALQPIDPPDGNIPTLPKTKAMAMAVTGPPNNLPAFVFSAYCCDNAAVLDRHAMFPHLSDDDIILRSAVVENDVRFAVIDVIFNEFILFGV